jgi:hypothetical protein
VAFLRNAGEKPKKKRILIFAASLKNVLPQFLSSRGGGQSALYHNVAVLLTLLNSYNKNMTEKPSPDFSSAPEQSHQMPRRRILKWLGVAGVGTIAGFFLGRQGGATESDSAATQASKKPADAESTPSLEDDQAGDESFLNAADVIISYTDQRTGKKVELAGYIDRLQQRLRTLAAPIHQVAEVEITFGSSENRKTVPVATNKFFKSGDDQSQVEILFNRVPGLEKYVQTATPAQVGYIEKAGYLMAERIFKVGSRVAVRNPQTGEFTILKVTDISDGTADQRICVLQTLDDEIVNLPPGSALFLMKPGDSSTSLSKIKLGGGFPKTAVIGLIQTGVYRSNNRKNNGVGPLFSDFMAVVNQ